MTFLLLVFSFICAIQTGRMYLAYRFLAGAQPHDKAVNGSNTMYLLIPVLNEQDVIEESFRTFERLIVGRPWLGIVFITSLREDAASSGPTTHELLRALIADSAEGQVKVIKSPNKQGVMAHQVNHAVDVLSQGHGSNLFFGLYNVDSTPPGAAIDHAFLRLSSNPSLVLQQYTAYPPEPLRQRLSQRVLSHVAAWQTRWSLHFELGRVLLDRWSTPDLQSKRKFMLLLRSMHYTIGHGLFFSRSTFDIVSGFAEDEINEDAQLGLALHVLGRYIEPVPYLEIAEPPPTLGAYVRQQAVWFNGPLYAFRYARKLLTGSDGRHRARPAVTSNLDRLLVIIAAGRLSAHAFYWLVGPAALLGFTVMVFWHGAWPARLMWLALVHYYIYGLNALGHLYAKSTSSAYAGAVQPSRDPIAALVAYLLHSSGPLLCLFRVALGVNLASKKYKTARGRRPDTCAPGHGD